MYNHQLDAFICVADCGSFSKAAEKLFISSTAVMKQMNLLENELGVKLFERTNQGVRMTACGESVYKDAKFMISYSEKAIKRAEKLKQTENYTIRVGTSMLNPCKVFMDLWYQASSSFPEFKIHIIPFDDDNNNILSVIGSVGERFDFIVGVCDSLKWLEMCSFYKLGDYRISMAVPVNHPLAAKKSLKITDLYGENILMVKKGDSQVNDAIREDIINNHPQIKIEDTPNFYDIEVFNYCEKSGSILSIPECWADIHPSLVMRQVDWDYRIPYGLLYSKEPSRMINKFLEAVKLIK